MRSTLPHAVGAWNLRVGRRPDVVAAEVDDLLTTHDLDVLLVCEAAAYIGAIRRRLRGRYRLATGRPGDPSARDSAIIVRKGMRRGVRRVHRLERKGWERKPGRPGLHHPRSAVSQRVAGVRYLAVHVPPQGGPNQPLRREAILNSLSTLTSIGYRWTGRDRRWVMAGDWNLRPGDQEARTAADKTGARIVGAGIDWVMHHRVRVTGYRKVAHGNSDHRPILFEVWPW